MAGAQTSETLARQMRKRLAELVDDFVRQIKELPSYSVFAEPVLRQSARQLYEALIEGLETGDAQLLIAHAVDQATRRRQQGVTQKELDQVAEIFAKTTQDSVAQLKIDDVPSAQAAIKPLLDSLGSAFKAEQAEAADDAPAPKRRSRRKKSPSLAKKPATRSGGKRMTNRHENEFDHESILEQLQQQARQLETSAQVSRQLTAALDLNELLLQVVELIKNTFDYYHVHIYLLDIESGYLIMREGTGEVGQTLKARGHRIESGRGMVGTVAKSGEPLLTPDVSKIENWLPNPLLPETKSELTVPLKIGDRILGVLDVQSDEVGGLTETDLALMESLAQQTAVAVQNAILFRETRAVSIISRAVSSGLGMEEFFSAVSRELRAVLDFDYMTVATYYEIVGQVELVGVEDRTDVDIPLEEGVQLPIDLCIPGMAIQQGRSIIVPNLEAEPFSTFIDAEILVKNGMRSQVSVPLQTRGQIVATINFVSREELAFTAADAHLMEQISGQLASALENAQIFENIQQMVEERASESVVFRAMVENASEAIALGNVQQILTYANPAFYALHGYDPETDDLTRRSLTSFIVSEDEGAFSDEVRDHILGGGMWRDEVQHRRKDGTLFQALTTFFAVRDEAGEPIAVAALIRDVTAERKIMAISQVASSTPDLDRLAPLVLEEIAADTDIDRAVLILYDQVTDDGPESMSVIAVYDPETGGERIVDEHLQAQDSPFSTIVYHERSAVWVADVATDERLFEQGRELLLRHNIVAMLALPIMVRDAVVGMVAIDWRKPVDLSYDQISLYQVMVNQVSTAVENARLVAQQQQALEETLDRRVREVTTSIEVGQAIATAPELDELFNRVVTLIKERFGYYHAHVYQIDREQNELEMMAGYGEPGRIMRERGHRIPMGRGLTGTAATTGQTVRVDDVSKQEAWLPNPLLPDTKSELAVPIKLGDEVLGVLDVQSDQLAGLSEDDELLLLGLCGQIAVSIQNTQILSNVQHLVEERTRQVAMFQALAENSVDAIGLVDAEGTLTYVNRAFGRVFGFDVSLDKVVGQSFYALLEEGKEALAKLREEASATGRAQLDLRYLRQGGDVFFGETIELPIVSEQGEPMATAYLVRDVTDRQRLERITREIARASGLRELASSVLIGLIEGTGIDHAALVLYDEVEDGSPTTGSYVATYDHEADEVAFPGQHFLVAQFPVTERLYTEQQAIRIDSPRDAQLDKNSREFMKRYQYGAGLLLPIISREHAIGFVILALHETVAFTAAQAQGYQTIVNQVGAAIENANLQAVQQLQLMNTIRRLGQQVATVTEVAQEISAAPALEETTSAYTASIPKRRRSLSPRRPVSAAPGSRNAASASRSAMAWSARPSRQESPS
jgi:PAS domain S-box-containing protein